MAAPKAPLLDAAGKKSKDVTLEESIFAADVKLHLVHETVRAEMNERRAGTRGAKSRGMVAGGRAKPWRQKGTGRARQGTIRAPQFTGGGVVFPPSMRSFDVKVNRKVRRSALRGALGLAIHLHLERAHPRREDDAAAFPLRRAGRALARAAGALLPPRLRAAAGNHATALRAARAGAALVQLRAHRLVDEVQFHVGGEDRLLQRDVLRLLAGRVEQRCFGRGH